MDQETLVSEEIDAGADFVTRFDKFMPVKAAFWVKPAEEGHWYLYVASDAIGGEGLTAGYGEVVRIAREMRTPYFDPFRVKLIGADDRLARAVLEYRGLYPNNVPFRYRHSNLGGIGIDGAYFYGVPAAVDE